MVYLRELSFQDMMCGLADVMWGGFVFLAAIRHYCGYFGLLQPEYGTVFFRNVLEQFIDLR